MVCSGSTVGIVVASHFRGDLDGLWVYGVAFCASRLAGDHWDLVSLILAPSLLDTADI